MYFLSEKSVISAYEDLSQLDVKNPSILHIFLLLKSCGYNDIEYLSPHLISERSYLHAFKLSALFSPDEVPPEKYDFINPFELSGWNKQSPSEPLKKWVSSRVKNNVLGGATTWRTIASISPSGNEFKFTYEYVNEIKKLTIKEDRINLASLVIWNNRFTSFENKPSLKKLIEEFVKEYNLTERELSTLFRINKNEIIIDYDTKMHNCKLIRTKLGSPTEEDWLESKILNNNESISMNRKEFVMVDTKTEINKEMLLDLLKKQYQVIFSGPPATSKSFWANEIANDFDKVEKVQFHPQYSYQEFMGGYFVESDKVKYRKGILQDLIEYAQKNPKKSVLLIIDEINRANAGQVMGEALQCLDRNYKTEALVNGKLEQISLPKNLFIIGTMNTSDRTIGYMDHALKRRFYNVYFAPNELELENTCSFDGDVSLSDLLKKINNNIAQTLRNKELKIGQAVFYTDGYKDGDKYIWDYKKLQELINYQLVPIIEDYCYGDDAKVLEILGEKIPQRLHGDDFISAIEEYMI